MSEEAAVADVAAEIKELGDKIAELTIKQAVDLKNYLKEAYGIEPAAGGAVMVAGGGGGDEGGGADAAPTEFDVILKDAGGQKIKVIKAIREITGLGLKEAKDMADNPGKALKEGLGKEEAEAMEAQLKELGATVELVGK